MEQQWVLNHELLLNGDLSHSLIVVNNPTYVTSDNTLLIHLLKTASLVVVADGAANFIETLSGFGIKSPNVICGDFDSTSNATLHHFRSQGSEIIHLDSQNHTDLQKSIHVVACKHIGIDSQCQSEILSLELRNHLELDLIVFGAFGGRFDHEMSAIHELYQFRNGFRSLTLVSDHNLACLLKPGRTIIRCHKELQNSSACGLLPLGSPVQSVSTQGLQWDLLNQSLEMGRSVSTSNRIIANSVIVESSDPVVWTASLQSISR